MDETGHTPLAHLKGPVHLGDDSLGEASTLLEHLHPRTFRAGERIFAEKDPGDTAFIIWSGIAKVSRTSGDGTEFLIGIIGPGDIVGELAVFDPGPRTANVTAVTDVRAGTLDRDTLRTSLVDNPQVGDAVLRLLARQIKRRHDQLAETAGMDERGRVAVQLLYLAARFGIKDGDAVRIGAPLPTAEIADLSGTSEVALNDVLKELEEYGWVRTVGSELVVSDHAALLSVVYR